MDDAVVDSPLQANTNTDVATAEVETVPTPADEPAADELRQVMADMEVRLSRELADLHKCFDDRLAYDRFKEEQVDRLHAELQEYKRDLLARVSRPLLSGVIRIHCDLGRTVASLRDRPPEALAAEELSGALDDVRDDLEVLLEQHGVEPFEVPGDRLDPERQTVARTVTTADPERVGQIAERVRPGFVQGATLLQREKVAVYVGGAQPSLADPAVSTPTDSDPGGRSE
jgi:molecular chaperone GrpE